MVDQLKVGPQKVRMRVLPDCRELVAGYTVPKVVHLVDAPPTTPSGKVRKVDLVARLAADASGGAG